ncbi:hypothetical protein ccbrp13_54830 [Ktedonobacteria bacterium brp13]|nr:hypothetical protein ccbrp13_54830 [Ktedonobacteria bacterium brp13]
MSKTKMRCTTCGKWFQSANAKEVTCPECTQKIRKEKQAIKNAPPIATKESNGHTAHNTQSAQYSSPRPTVPPKPKPVKSGTNQWLDSLSDVKVGQPDTPQRPKVPSPLPNPAHQERATRPTAPNGPGGYRNTTTNNQGPVPGPANNRPNGPARGPAAYHPSNGGGLSPTIGQRPPAPRQSQESPYGRGPGGQSARKPWQKSGAPGAAGTASPPGAAKPHKPGKPGRPAAYAKPKREKTPPPVPFTPSAEQIQQIEERYIVLAQPVEFDGIRGQIAKELNIPKRAIKKVVKDLRDRQHIPSWWELQSYKGSNEDLEQIKSAYQPYLPIPPVGVHKLIADQLHLKPGDIYQAIKSIRLELNLPQYNDPQLHTEEQVTSTKSAETVTEQPDSASGASTGTTAPDVH